MFDWLLWCFQDETITEQSAESSVMRIINTSTFINSLWLLCFSAAYLCGSVSEVSGVLSWTRGPTPSCEPNCPVISFLLLMDGCSSHPPDSSCTFRCMRWRRGCLLCFRFLFVVRFVENHVTSDRRVAVRCSVFVCQYVPFSLTLTKHLIQLYLNCGAMII